MIKKVIDDLKVRRNLCEDDLRLLQQKLNSLQEKIFAFKLAEDETKSSILEQAVAERKNKLLKRR